MNAIIEIIDRKQNNKIIETIYGEFESIDDAKLYGVRVCNDDYPNEQWIVYKVTER